MLEKQSEADVNRILFKHDIRTWRQNTYTKMQFFTG